MNTNTATPCACRLNRETAMTCTQPNLGVLEWGPAYKSNGHAVGPAAVVALDGRRAVLTFDGNEWEHYSEQLARDHARIRHLKFVVVA